MKFRALPTTLRADPKYLGLDGISPKLFNTVDMLRSQDEIHFCEGELDAVTASIHGLPAVALPGAEAWRPHFTQLFAGFRRVTILADGDSAGREAAQRWIDKLSNARVVYMPDGEDVNSVVSTLGIDWIKDKLS